MAGELTQESVLDFLQERGGKATNAELLDHFRAELSAEEPRRKTAARQAFKTYVDRVAFVKTESGVKHVCVKKRFRGSSCGGAESPRGPGPKAASGRQVSGGDDAAPRTPGGDAGSGNETKPRVPRFLAAESVLAERAEQNRAQLEFVRIAEDVDGWAGMGNRGSSRSPSRSLKVQQGQPAIPTITVHEALPLPEEEAAFDRPGSERTGLSPKKKRQAETPKASSAVDDRSRLSLSESEGDATPTHRHFIQGMVDSSPEVRRHASLRNSVHRSDAASQASASVEDDVYVTLDPVEHEWMLCASDGEWASLQRLLAEEPSLVQKKDFVTGFTCLHWAAKQGKHELMALILRFAKEHKVPVSVDVRSNMGYTPLHVAAMHNRMEVVKLLVGAFNADVEVRDYSGRKACQYLANGASLDIQDIIGAYRHSESENPDRRGEGRWRFSRVLQSSLRLQSNVDSLEVEGRPREKAVRRRSSFNMIKPKVQKLRLRASQIVHSASFNDGDNVDVFRRGSFKSRPHTHLFG